MDIPIRTASTTMLIREKGDLQVLMVKRNQEIDFFSGAMIFPGGKVDPQDLDSAWAGSALGLEEVPEEERGPRIAALREAFEECGVIAAAGEVSISETDALEARAAVESGRLTFLDFVRSRGIVVDLRRLTLFSRWLTPPVVPKRFDTFFYLVEMPEGQHVTHDGRETVANEWVTPSGALHLAETGQRTILFPTRMNLGLLAEASSLADAVARAGMRPPRQVVPTLLVRDGRRYLQLAEEDGYGFAEELLAIRA